MKNRVTKSISKKVKCRRNMAPSKSMKIEGTPVPGQPVAQEINELHENLTGQFAGFAAESVLKAIQIGEKLKSVKKALGHSHWNPWVKKHLKFNVRTACRYMALAKTKAKKTVMSDLKACSSLMAAYVLAGIIPKESNDRKVPFKLFSPAAGKILNLPIERISEPDKETIRREFERLESIAIQLYEHPSIFAVTWQNKLQALPSRWTRNEVAVFKEAIRKAEEILAKVEEDIQFDAIPASPKNVRKKVVIEGDAP